jgi:polar amino acid transport system substrate-binding protein
MRNSLLRYWLILLFFSNFENYALAGQYQIVTEEWAPYNYTEKDQIVGITTDIVKAIMRITGDDFQITILPGLRSTLILSTHSKTIMYSVFRTAQREHLYKWVGPIMEESIFPYQLAIAQPVQSLNQLLETKKITTRRGGLINSILESKGFANLDDSAGSDLQLYRMLIAHRTDIIVGNTPAGVAYYTNFLKIAPETLRQIPVEIYRSSLYIAFSPDSDDSLITAWAHALESLRRSGELERIKLRYE